MLSHFLLTDFPLYSFSYLARAPVTCKMLWGVLFLGFFFFTIFVCFICFVVFSSFWFLCFNLDIFNEPVFRSLNSFSLCLICCESHHLHSQFPSLYFAFPEFSLDPFFKHSSSLSKIFTLSFVFLHILILVLKTTSDNSNIWIACGHFYYIFLLTVLSLVCLMNFDWLQEILYLKKIPEAPDDVIFLLREFSFTSGNRRTCKSSLRCNPMKMIQGWVLIFERPGLFPAHLHS